jgi:hypothetical protein
MSRYTFSGKEPRYRIIVGWDPARSSLFAQVEDLAWESDGQTINPDAPIGDTPEEGLLVWVGADVPITDPAELVRAVAPYGSIPEHLIACLQRDQATFQFDQASDQPETREPVPGEPFPDVVSHPPTWGSGMKEQAWQESKSFLQRVSMWWQHHLRRLFPLVLLVLLVGAGGYALGLASPLSASRALSVSHAVIVPITTAPWDTRPCAQFPSAATCDGKLVAAPRDLSALSHAQGSGACFNQYAHQVSLVLSETSTHVIVGELQLWSFPTCQSHAARAFWSRDGVADFTVALRLLHQAPSGDPWAEEENFVISYTASVSGRDEVWSPLAWSPIEAISACGTIVVAGRSVQGCTSWWMASLSGLLP